MGYSNLKDRKQHEADAARIAELEAQLKIKRESATGHVTIEKTSRNLKMRLLISWLAIIVGIILCYFSASDAELAMTQLPKVGGIITAIGLVSLVATKITIWWRHG